MKTMSGDIKYMVKPLLKKKTQQAHGTGYKKVDGWMLKGGKKCICCGAKLYAIGFVIQNDKEILHSQNID